MLVICQHPQLIIVGPVVAQAEWGSVARKTLSLVNETLPALQWLDVSDNNLQHVQGVERCAALRHLDVTNNNLNAFGPGQNSLMVVASSCRMLQVLRCGRNSIDVNALTQHLAGSNPQCRVDNSRGIASSGGAASSGGCCTVM